MLNIEPQFSVVYNDEIIGSAAHFCKLDFGHRTPQCNLKAEKSQFAYFLSILIESAFKTYFFPLPFYFVFSGLERIAVPEGRVLGEAEEAILCRRKQFL